MKSILVFYALLTISAITLLLYPRTRQETVQPKTIRHKRNNLIHSKQDINDLLERLYNALKNKDY